MAKSSPVICRHFRKLTNITKGCTGSSSPLLFPYAATYNTGGTQNRIALYEPSFSNAIWHRCVAHFNCSKMLNKIFDRIEAFFGCHIYKR